MKENRNGNIPSQNLYRQPNVKNAKNRPVSAQPQRNLRAGASAPVRRQTSAAPIPQGRQSVQGERKPLPRKPKVSFGTKVKRFLFGVIVAVFVSVAIIWLVTTAVNMNRNEILGQYGEESPYSDRINSGVNADSVMSDEYTSIGVSYALSDLSTVNLGNEIKSEFAILIDVSNNKVLAQKGGNSIIYPASMTKVMTLIVAYENAKSLDDKYTFSYELINPLVEQGASMAGFSSGETVTVEELMYGAILPSGADATEALAIAVAGDSENFVGLMNKKVRELGLENTHFMNTSGLHHNNHYSTPHDMALIVQYAMKIDKCREILSTYKYTTNPTDKHPEGLEFYHTMFSRMKGDEAGSAEVIGGKTGYTNEALNCLASFAESDDGRELVLVTAKGANTYDPVWDAIYLYGEFTKSTESAESVEVEN